jgi:hypothetical protein
MIKRIFLWTTYTVIVGLLIFGAVNRTAAKSDQGVLIGRSASVDQKFQSRGGLGNSVSTSEAGNTEHEEIITDHDWIDLSGKVLEFDGRSLVILVDGNVKLEFAGRAWRFIQENGYQPNLGTHLTLSGFYENDEFKAASLKDLNTGELVIIRDMTGHPLWR